MSISSLLRVIHFYSVQELSSTFVDRLSSLFYRKKVEFTKQQDYHVKFNYDELKIKIGVIMK